MAAAAGYTAEHLAAGQSDPGEYHVEGQGVDISLTQAPGQADFMSWLVIYLFIFICSRFNNQKRKINQTYC